MIESAALLVDTVLPNQPMRQWVLSVPHPLRFLLKLERLCRYLSRPPVSKHRLSLTLSGKICYQLKTAYRNGTTHVIFEPLDFISKPAALVPSPRVNLTQFHGLFAQNSRYRADIIKQKSVKKSVEKASQTTYEKRRAMNLAARLKRAFNTYIYININTR